MPLPVGHLRTTIANRLVDGPPADADSGCGRRRQGIIDESDAKVRDIGWDGYEIAMLFGIRSAGQLRLAREGFSVRTLISYGSHWYPWFMRGIAEKPIENTLVFGRSVGRGVMDLTDEVGRNR